MPVRGFNFGSGFMGGSHLPADPVYGTHGNFAWPSDSKPVVLLEMELDGGTERESDERVNHPSYSYRPRVVEWGSANRELSGPPPTLPVISAMEVGMSDVDNYWRTKNALITQRNRPATIRVGPSGGSVEHFPVAFSGRLDRAKYSLGKYTQPIKDVWKDWLKRQIPNWIDRTNFPNQPDGQDSAFFPMVFGRVDSPPDNLQGQIKLICIDTTTNEYAANRTAINEVIRVTRKLSGESSFTVVSASEYTVTTISRTIDGITYPDIAVIRFNSDQTANELRADIDGINFRGDFGESPVMPAVSGTIENPTDHAINLLYYLGLLDSAVSTFDSWSFLETWTKYHDLGLKFSFVFDQQISFGEALARINYNSQQHIFPNKYAQIAAAFLYGSDDTRPVFTDDLDILRSGGVIRGESDADQAVDVEIEDMPRTINQLECQYLRNFATGQFADKYIYDNEDDQDELGEIEQDSFQFLCIRDEYTMHFIAAYLAGWYSLQASKVVWWINAPKNIHRIELGDSAGLTHYAGKGGPWTNQETWLFGVLYDLTRQMLRLTGYIHPALAVEPVEEEVEADERGGFWVTDQGMVGSDETFDRASFEFDTDDYDEVEEYLFGGIVASNDGLNSHNCYILDEDDNVVGTLTVPPNAFGAPRQWLAPAPWTPLNGRHTYRCKMGSFGSGGIGNPDAHWAPLILDPVQRDGYTKTVVRYTLGGNNESGPQGTLDGGVGEDGTNHDGVAFESSNLTIAVDDGSQALPERWCGFRRLNSRWGGESKVADICFASNHGWGGLGFAAATALAYLRLANGPPAGPGVSIDDDFNRANDDQLDGQTASGGFSWALVEGSSGLAQIDVDGNRALVLGQSLACSYRAEIDLDSANHSCEAEVFSTNVDNLQAVCCRFDSAGATYYVASIDRSGSNVLIAKIIAGGVPDVIDTFPASVLNDGTHQLLKLTVTGTTLKAYLDGVLVGTSTDGDITGGTRAGIRGYSTLIASSAGGFENFSAYDGEADPGEGAATFEVIHTSGHEPNVPSTTGETRIDHIVTRSLAATMPDDDVYSCSLYRHGSASNIRAKAYSAHAVVKLHNLEAGNQYERVYDICRSWEPSASGVMLNRRQAVDLTHARAAYLEINGQMTSSGGHNFYLFDCGTSKTGDTGSIIPASAKAFTDTARDALRSVDILAQLTSHNLYGLYYEKGAGAGRITGCARLVIVYEVPEAEAATIDTGFDPEAGAGESQSSSSEEGGGLSGNGAAIAGTEYFVSPAGGGSGLTRESPTTMSDALNNLGLVPGDGITMLDGTYTGASGMIAPPSGLSGTASAKIIIRADNDGDAIIDGEGARIPLYLTGNSYFVFEGFNCRNSSGGVCQIFNGSNHNEFYQIIARDAADANHMCWDVADSHFNHFEDCAAFGIARKPWQFYQANDNTRMRCFGMFNASTHDFGFETPMMASSLAYNSFRNKDIDGIYTVDVDGSQGSANAVLYSAAGADFMPDVDDRCELEYIGTAVFVLASQSINLSSGTDLIAGMYIGQGLNNVLLKHCAIYVGHAGAKTISLNNYSGSNGAQNQVAENITEVGAGSHDYGSGWTRTNCEKAATVAGVANIWNGGGSAGARIYYRRDANGDLTSTARWPWPMNQRLIDELTAAGRTALDVTATMQSIWGALP